MSHFLASKESLMVSFVDMNYSSRTFRYRKRETRPGTGPRPIAVFAKLAIMSLYGSRLLLERFSIKLLLFIVASLKMDNKVVSSNK